MVLVVESYRDSCRAVESLLHREGFEVRCACDGRAALDLLLKKKPLCIVVNAQSLLDPPSLDVLRAMLGAHSGIPVIIFSDVGDSFVRRAALNLGAADWVSKLDCSRLGPAVRRAIGPIGPTPQRERRSA